MASSDIVDSNSLICGRFDKIDFEILFNLAGSRNLWYRKIVDDRTKVEFRAWISRNVEREICMYEYAFDNAVTSAVTNALGIKKTNSSHYDMYFFDFDGEKRDFYLPTFLKDLLAPGKQVMSIVVELKQVAPSLMKKTQDTSKKNRRHHQQKKTMQAQKKRVSWMLNCGIKLLF